MDSMQSDPSEILSRIFGQTKSEDERAADAMHDVVDHIVQFYRENAYVMQEVEAEEGTTITPSVVSRFLDNLAGQIMYTLQPSAIAFTLAALAKAHADLLDKAK